VLERGSTAIFLHESSVKQRSVNPGEGSWVFKKVLFDKGHL
jgi:hypothetical protein